jgi:hypothetical protein
MENTTTNPVPITHTLFNIVSFRSPQLSNESQQHLKFIQRPTNDSVFDEVTSALSTKAEKWSALKNAAANFSWHSLDDIKSEFSEMYQLATKLAADKAYIDTLLLNPPTINHLSIDKVETLWNNLIYQVVTQKDFYIKETIMQILVANHVISKFEEINNLEQLGYQSALAVLQELGNATVVLPLHMFTDSNTEPITTTISQPKPTAPNSFMLQNQKSIAANKNIQNLEQLKAEIKNFEKEYLINNEINLLAYTQNHETEVANILNEHYTQVAAAKAAWLANNEPTSYSAENPYLQPDQIPAPSLPKFNYVNSSIDYGEYTQNLTETAYVTFANLFNFNISNSRGYQHLTNNPSTQIPASYQEILQKIDTEIATLQNTIVNNTTKNQQLVSIGGVLVNEQTNFRNALEYQICPRRTEQNVIVFDMGFDVPEADWEMASMNYTFTANGNPYNNTSFEKSTTGNAIFLANLCNPGIPLDEFGINNQLTGEISFTNGIVISFEVQNLTTNQCFTGKFSIINSANDSSVAAVFVPNGFGYKQIGIADYKKVEQTLHGYVPGEVSHIENIMAREYKEKSTRRLRKSETTETTSSETEKEKLTDTSSTSRFELQNEVDKVLQETRDFNANATFNASYGGKLAQLQVGAAANYATHNSKEESTKQAMTEAKEITEKALDRLVTKVKTERTVKMIEEYEENNLHGFDNKKGDKHVSGVYRWLDKIMKNRIVNFGKRLMFEFMIPQPAKLHTLGLKNEVASQILVKPEDPRTHNSIFQLTDYTQVTENNAKYWASKLNAEIKATPEQEKQVGTSFEFYAKTGSEGGTKNGTIKLPEGYIATKAAVTLSGAVAGYAQGVWGPGMNVIVGNKVFSGNGDGKIEFGFMAINNYTDTVPISFSQTGRHTTKANITVCCQLSTEALRQWQLDTFNAIMSAFYDAELDYENAISQEKLKASTLKQDNPAFYRQIENTILRKNCISYLIDKNANAIQTYGLGMSNGNNAFNSYEVNNTAALDQYSALAKFLEQSFEWNLMSYNLYPYYWAAKQDWSVLYQTENADPLFRSFLQSGMARVVVTVRPGFENAVQHYMATGQIWNGGQVPVIDHPLYLSIVDEIKTPNGQPEGKAWITRVPTVLTMIQANSIGLPVSNALPCITDDAADFEHPNEVPNYNELQVEVALIENASTSTITDVANIEIDNGELQLTNNANPSQVLAAIPIADIKTALGI